MRRYLFLMLIIYGCAGKNQSAETEKLKTRWLALSEFDLDTTVHTYLFKRYDNGESLNKTQRLVLATFILESEVFNGGFDQYYINYKLQFIDEAIEALKLFGANEFAQLAAQSKEIYLREQPTPGHIRNPVFDTLDEQFYALTHYAPERVAFVRANIEEIIE